MARLDIERQQRLELPRLNYASQQICKLGYTVTVKDGNSLQFEHNGSTVTFFPYSGWATGKSINDGRGLQRLLKQLKQK